MTSGDGTNICTKFIGYMTFVYYCIMLGWVKEGFWNTYDIDLPITLGLNYFLNSWFNAM